MKIHWLKRKGGLQLVLFFGGFACDENLLARVNIPSGCDVAMLYDYRDFDFEMPQLNYEHVSVIAWSFGVWVAEYWRDMIPENSDWTAINGSLYPVDDVRGIPQLVFEKTVENFDEAAKEKFFRRVCGGARQYEENRSLLSNRSAAALKAELEFLGKAFKSEHINDGRWETAVASSSDKIFPLENMKNAWGAAVSVADGEHLNLKAFDAAFAAADRRAGKIRAAFEKHMRDYEENAVVQREISDQLSELIEEHMPSKSVGNVLEIGCGTGFLTRALLPKIEYSHWWLNDLSEDMCRYAARHLHDNFDILAGDILSSMPDAKLDLIVSASCFQWIEDLEKLIGRIRDWSNPDSILAFSTFGESNFFQLRQLGIEGLKYYSLEETSEILKRAGYEVLHISEDRVDMVFDSPLDVLRHIKITGVNGGFAEFWTPAMAKQFSAQYEKHFNDGDSVTLTYHPVLVVAKKI